MLSAEDFQHVVKNTPLFAIDLVLLSPDNKVLLGKRCNAPAQGYWFVPGGRVYKNETLSNAFLRIFESELGSEFVAEYNYQNTHLLGIFEHFYPDSALSSVISTHYITAAQLVLLSSRIKPNRNIQHSDTRWLTIEELENDDSVHPYSRIFLTELKQIVEKRK